MNLWTTVKEEKIRQLIWVVCFEQILGNKKNYLANHNDYGLTKLKNNDNVQSLKTEVSTHADIFFDKSMSICIIYINPCSHALYERDLQYKSLFDLSSNQIPVCSYFQIQNYH